MRSWPRSWGAGRAAAVYMAGSMALRTIAIFVVAVVLNITGTTVTIATAVVASGNIISVMNFGATVTSEVVAIFITAIAKRTVAIRANRLITVIFAAILTAGKSVAPAMFAPIRFPTTTRAAVIDVNLLHTVRFDFTVATLTVGVSLTVARFAVIVATVACPTIVFGDNAVAILTLGIGVIEARFAISIALGIFLNVIICDPDATVITTTAIVFDAFFAPNDIIDSNGTLLTTLTNGNGRRSRLLWHDRLKPHNRAKRALWRGAGGGRVAAGGCFGSAVVAHVVSSLVNRRARHNAPLH